MTVLHPRHKLLYFHCVGWASDWIDVAEKLVHDEFEWYTGIETQIEEMQGIGSKASKNVSY